MNWRRVAIYVFILFCISPLIVFLLNIGNPSFYYGPGFPEGQGAYIMMRPAGHIAFMLLWFQILIGSSRIFLLSWFGIRNHITFHRKLGITALIFVLLHPLLFVTGVSIRAGTLKLGAFVPGFQPDFWHFIVSFGALSFYFILSAVIAAIAGRKIGEKTWRIVHCLNYLAFFVAFYHAMNIGGETRITPVNIQYWFMVSVVVIVMLSRIIEVFALSRPGKMGIG